MVHDTRGNTAPAIATPLIHLLHVNSFYIVVRRKTTGSSPADGLDYSDALQAGLLMHSDSVTRPRDGWHTTAQNNSTQKSGRM